MGRFTAGQGFSYIQIQSCSPKSQAAATAALDLVDLELGGKAVPRAYQGIKPFLKSLFDSFCPHKTS